MMRKDPLVSLMQQPPCYKMRKGRKKNMMRKKMRKKERRK